MTSVDIRVSNIAKNKKALLKGTSLKVLIKVNQKSHSRVSKPN